MFSLFKRSVSLRPRVDVAGAIAQCHWSIFRRLHGPDDRWTDGAVALLFICYRLDLWHLVDICHPVLLCFSRKDFVTVVFWEQRHSLPHEEERRGRGYIVTSVLQFL